VAAGSVSQTTLDQLARAEARGFGPWVAGEAVSPAYGRRRTLLLSTVRSREGLSRRDMGAAQSALESLARRAAALVRPGGLLLLTGGHTLETYYAMHGYEGNWIEGELLPGLPFGRASGRGRIPQWMASKPGGFGKPGDLAKVLGRVVAA
jgi:uncharacterized protein YgbK (DUF1537 family)